MPVQMTLAFDYSTMDIAPRESILLTLPGFSCAERVGVSIMDGAYVASWLPEQQQLRIDNVNEMPRLVRTAVVLPLSLGLRLPTLGVFFDHQIALSTAAADGPVSSMKIESVAVVGSFSATELGFGVPPHTSGDRSGINFMFTPLMSLAVSDTITLSLPRFFLQVRRPASLWM